MPRSPQYKRKFPEPLCFAVVSKVPNVPNAKCTQLRLNGDINYPETVYTQLIACAYI